MLERPGFELRCPRCPRCPTSVRHRPSAPTRIDFEEHARWVASALQPGDHLVGHSYGGVIALLAAARVESVAASLTVIEPPCTSVALDDPAVAAFAKGGAGFWRDVRATIRRRSSANSSPPSARTSIGPHCFQRRSSEALARSWTSAARGRPTSRSQRLAALALPTLVVSGAHLPPSRRSDALERELGAERLVIEGRGHNPQLDPRFTGALLDFVARGAPRKD